MIRKSALLNFAVVSLIAGLLSGCVPEGDDKIDEAKEPHYQRGEDLASNQDFDGAIAEFEKAIEANPRSALAHFKLAVICEQHNKSYAEAIYHYEQHLKLQPKSDYAPRAKEQIEACIRELARGKFSQPSTQNLQRDLDRVLAENIQFKQQLEGMRTQLVASVSALATAQRAVSSAEAERDSAIEALTAARTAAAARSPSSSSYASAQGFQPPSAVASKTTSRTGVHVVKSGETISSIAAQYGIRPNALLSANPKINPRRLRPGTSLTLPTR